MKSLPTLALTLLLPLLAPAAPPVEGVQQLLTEAQTAYARGDITTAKANFEMVYKIDPRNQVAIGYLRRIRAAEGAGTKGVDQEKSLAAVILPKVEFREATLGSALDYLKQAIAKASDGKQAVNFVAQVPEEQLKTQPVTLNLTNIPATEALRYLGGVAGLEFRYEKYAVVVKAKGSDTSAQAVPPAK
jgi:hypothetical protein